MTWLRRGRRVETVQAPKKKRERTLEAQLGAEILIRRYKGCPTEMVIRKVQLHTHLHHLRIERIDLKPWVHEISYTADFVGMRGPYGVWEAAHKEIFIYDNWQVRPEMRYGFVSYPRWDDPPKLDLKAMERAIEQNNWIFAKTMAYNPHWYALRKKWDNSEMAFDTFVHIIRGHGYTQEYNNAKYRCLNVGKHFYWSMGAPFVITTLVNRKPLL